MSHTVQVDEHLECDGEAQGLARIKAAIHAHTWSGLRMHPTPRFSPAPTSSLITSTSPDVATNDAVGQTAEATASTYIPPDAPNEASAAVGARQGGNSSSTQVPALKPDLKMTVSNYSMNSV